jgi:DNA-directed RNA polymerase subunit RPC12/RpoP
VANPRDGVTGPVRAAVGVGLNLYLCSSCGQEGVLGREWLSKVYWSGEVRCPSCNQAMAETMSDGIADPIHHEVRQTYRPGD